jgi:ATP-binding cassette subfamily B protein
MKQKQHHFKEMLKDTGAILGMIAGITKAYLPLMIIKNLLQTSLPFVNIIFSSMILDHIIEKISMDLILSQVYWMIGLNLVLGVSVSLLTKLLNVRTEYVNRAMEAKIANKAITLDYEQLEKKESLELLFKAKDGSGSHGGIMSFCNSLGSMIGHIISLIYSFALLSTLFTSGHSLGESLTAKIIASPILSILLFLLYFVALWINFQFVKKVNEYSYVFFEKNVEGNRLLTYFILLANNYNFGKDIRIYHMADMIAEEMNNANASVSGTLRELGRITGKYNGRSEIVNQITIYITYAYVGIRAMLGLISVGNILKYVSTLIKFMNSISFLLGEYADFDLQRQYLRNYCLFLELENKKYEGTLPIEKRDDNEYDLEFKNVSFHYPNSEEMILNNISLKLKVGKKLAIVGRNGAGKTTFIKLLCRLYDPTEGEILLNGINIKKYDYQEYLKVFSVVFQDFKLFSFDIAQNVAANVDYEEARVWEALEKAGVAERVEQMKDKIKTNLYQTQENGVEISGGEAQKLAIARALYKNSPVVILDEPTSALDPVSEYEIYARFDELVSERTSIYISHRMSSCRFCDNIVVFDGGKIIQKGSHEALMKEEKGLYHEMWNAQSKYYNQGAAS